MAPRAGLREAVDAMLPAPVASKLSASDAGYTSGGPVPFVCARCRSYTDDGSCLRVVGPYQNGTVLPFDTCTVWEPSADLTEGGPVQGEGSEDEVPALLAGDEYVVPPGMVENLGGEERLDEIRKRSG